MILATEDAIAEAVAVRLVRDAAGMDVGARLGGRGKGYLKNRVQELNRTARSVPVLLMIDLDSPARCPADVINSWIGNRNAQFIFRIAVMEVESWLLADREEFADAFGLRVEQIPVDSDGIAEPKELIVSLARRSKKKTVRRDLVPTEGSTASVGPAYNPALINFVRERWNLNAAAVNSASLRRAVKRLAPFRVTN